MFDCPGCVTVGQIDDTKPVIDLRIARIGSIEIGQDLQRHAVILCVDAPKRGFQRV